MRVEIRENIKSGFRVDHIEMTRLKDAMNDQIKKINNGRDATFKYSVSFVNGAIAEPDSLDAILSEENHGSRRISDVSVAALAETEDLGSVQFSLSDIAHKSSAAKSAIQFIVKSADRDWAFVTSSIMQERLKKISTNWILNALLNGRSSSPFPLSSIIMIAVMFFGFWLIFPNHEQRVQTLQQAMNSSADVKDFIFKIEMNKLNQFPGDNPFHYLFLAPLAASIAIFWIVDSFKKYYPIYTFYWGDSVNEYKKRMSVLTFIFSGVILTIVLSILANYLYSTVF